jgi:hypothetical protein
MLIGFVAVLILQAIGLTYYLRNVQPPPSPSVLELTPHLILLPNPDLCPGDVIEYEILLTVMEPSIIEADISIINSDTGNTIAGTEFSVPARPRDKAESLTVPIRYTVPELPPGNYRRVTGVSPKNRGAETSFASVPFSIRRDCGD